MDYAYTVDDSWREGLVPDLRLAASQPWMGLTAYISNRPHLIIGHNGESYTMEDETGHRIEVSFEFPWEEPAVESNRIVAASRIEESPFKNAGLLSYDPESGEWAVRVGISNMRYPLEEHVAALEENGWKIAQDFDNQDVIVPVHGRCPNCGSDSLSYAEDEDNDDYGSSGAVDDFAPTAASEDPIVLCHACQQWCRESDLDTGTDDAAGNKHQEDSEPKESAVKRGSAPFSFQGAYAGPPGRHMSFIAFNADKSPIEELANMVGGLPTPHQQERDYVEQRYEQEGLSGKPYSYDNPFVNRGGSVHQAVAPEFFPGGKFCYVKKWFSPDDYTNAIGAQSKLNEFQGIVTSQGGMTSHAVVVARPNGILCVIAPSDDLVDRIETGDQVEILSNGVVNVNGGDPNFVAQDPGSVKVATAIARFVWAGGVGKFSVIDPQDINKVGTGHGDMLTEHMTEGNVQIDPATFDHNAVMGYIYDDGHVSEDTKEIPDQAQFEQWVTQVRHRLNLPIGPIQRIDTATYMPDNLKTGAAQNVDRTEDVLKCPECGSHTVEAYNLDKEKGNGEFGCLNCGNAFKADYRKHAGAEHSNGTRVELVHPAKKGIKGSITNHAGTDDNFGDHLYDIMCDNGDELKKVPESHFKKIKSASVEKTGVIIHTNLPTTGWHFGASGDAAAAGLEGTITYPDGTTLPIVSDKHQWYYALNPAIKETRERDGHFGSIPVVVDVNDPDKFLQIVEAHNSPSHTASEEPPQWFIDELNTQLIDELLRESSMAKGAPYPENSYKNAPDHTPKKQKKDWPEEVNAIYNACMREGNGRGDTKEEKQSSCAAIAWAQYKKNDGHPKDSDKNKESRVHPLPEDVLKGVPGGGYEQGNYEGHPVMCYMCGNERTASLGTQCEHCGYILAVRRDGPVPSKTWPKSAALEPGIWYTMHSPKYKVPDVIHVKEVSDEGVTASIEGDDKGLFPINLSHDEIKREGYSFERYTPVVDERTGNHFIETTKTARREFSAQEQKELVNENTSGRARNIHKLDLDGTHYPQNIEAANEDPLKAELYWWQKGEVMPKSSRAQFFRMHLLKCPTCRNEWLELRKSLPESRHNKLAEDVVRANHKSSVIA